MKHVTICYLDHVPKAADGKPHKNLLGKYILESEKLCWRRLKLNGRQPRRGMVGFWCIRPPFFIVL
jgi:hypothetical protein